MCNQHNKLSDRAFDSQVEADSARAQEGSNLGLGASAVPPKTSELGLHGPAGIAYARPLDQARAAFVAIQERIALEDQEQFSASEGEKKALLSALLAPFYKGSGAIDHVGLLSALEEFAGRPLFPHELVIFGALAGRYCAERAHAEFLAAPDSEKLEKFREIARVASGVAAQLNR